MCGILGILARDGELSREALSAVELLRHRGPDSEGRAGEGRIGLAMRRLAIIDIEGGTQPIANESGEIVCIANCEIYNFRELRADLERRGHTFRTAGDVEPLVHLYEELGDRFVEELRGMFAIAIWDAREQRLVLARDRMGIKPLYVAETPHGLGFASEIAPLLALGASDRVDVQAVADGMALGWISGAGTGFAEIERLAPSTVTVVEQGVRRDRVYWQPSPPIDPGRPLVDVLREAVRLHMISDVPVGVLLSGGLDSSLLAALAAEESEERLRTFTVGFADRGFDEREHARTVADYLGSVHSEIVVEPSLATDLPSIVGHLESPLSDASAIPLWYLCRAVGGEVKVALAGEGGDEVFGGYSRYAWDARAARLGQVLPAGTLAALLEALPGVQRRAVGSGRKDPIRRAVKLLRNAELPEGERYFAWFRLLADAAIAELLPAVELASPARWFDEAFAAAPDGLSPLGRLQYVDVRRMLADDLLFKADKVSMAHSLELRVPFVDHEVVNAGLFLPDRQKVRGVQTKLALRAIVADILPRSIAERPKQGFETPINRWMREDLLELAEATIGADDLGGALDAKRALALLERHRNGEVDAGLALYGLLVLGLWRSTVRARVKEARR